MGKSAWEGEGKWPRERKGDCDRAEQVSGTGYVSVRRMSEAEGGGGAIQEIMWFRLHGLHRENRKPRPSREKGRWVKELIGHRVMCALNKGKSEDEDG